MKFLVRKCAARFLRCKAQYVHSPSRTDGTQILKTKTALRGQCRWRKCCRFRLRWPYARTLPTKMHPSTTPYPRAVRDTTYSLENHTRRRRASHRANSALMADTTTSPGPALAVGRPSYISQCAIGFLQSEQPELHRHLAGREKLTEKIA